MIIRAKIENWCSFKECNKISMVATSKVESSKFFRNTKLHQLKRFNQELLPVAVIFGGNSTGKSNLVNAIDFVRNLVVSGTSYNESIPIKPFDFDKSYQKKPSKFEFVLLINNTVYKYNFILDSKHVKSEILKIIYQKKERILFERINKKLHVYLNYDEKAKKIYSKLIDSTELFLTKFRSIKEDKIAPVYNWFKDALRVITPHSGPRSFYTENFLCTKEYNNMLDQLDTGIRALKEKEINYSQLPYSLVDNLERSKEGTGGMVFFGDERITFKHEYAGKILASQIVATHNDNEIEFGLSQESAGTRRIIDLLPAFFDLVTSNKVYVIDEIDRSLHPILTKNLIEAYLNACDGTFESQLILTTHELHLLDEELLRRDEMWLTERNNHGETKIRRVDNYKFDVEKNVKNLYLGGRLGGIPKIIFEGSRYNPLVDVRDKKKKSLKRKKIDRT